MFDFFWKKRREAQPQRKVDQLLRAQEAEQQRKFEVVRDVQEAILALQARVYEPDRPQTLAQELARVSASIEQGRREN
ncbi:hypothetical protein [Pseudomonas silesiensis]|uniref:hypothetical protein n=1 Tax=Pseudomonas silesiensis TaxID=1853130 RepID=UPI0034D5108E